MAMDRITFRVPTTVKKAGEERAEELDYPTLSDYLRDLIRDDVGEEAIMAARREPDGRQPDLAETDGGG